MSEECHDFATEQGFNTHMMNAYSPNNVLIHFGADWIKEHTQYLNRNIKYAQNHSHSKKWDIVISKNKINIRSSGFCSLQSKVGVFCDTFIECGG